MKDTLPSTKPFLRDGGNYHVIETLSSWSYLMLFTCIGGISPKDQILLISERRCFDDLLTGLATAQRKTLEIGLNDQTNEEDGTGSQIASYLPLTLRMI